MSYAPALRAFLGGGRSLLARAAREAGERFGPQEAANVAWSCAVLRDAASFALCARPACRQLGSMQPREAAMLAWAAATLAADQPLGAALVPALAFGEQSKRKCIHFQIDDSLLFASGVNRESGILRSELLEEFSSSHLSDAP